MTDLRDEEYYMVFDTHHSRYVMKGGKPRIYNRRSDASNGVEIQKQRSGRIGYPEGRFVIHTGYMTRTIVT